MEHPNQPRGVADDITSQQHTQPDHQPAPEAAPPEVPIYQAEAPHQRPLVTFTEAAAHNPFSLLTELHDQAMALRLHEKPSTFHLTELALSAAVVAWWSRWQPIAMHRALVAGASLSEVAAAAGTSEAETYQRWNEWGEQQSRLVIAGRVGVDAAEVAEIRARYGDVRRDAG